MRYKSDLELSIVRKEGALHCILFLIVLLHFGQILHCFPDFGEERVLVVVIGIQLLKIV